ncbi:MAG: hypothetical protein QGG34_16375 [SAR202 cluster bacterium]|nr:hypothetical protein [SAR202 cluster bacterium]MDP6302493.1 hypothetical protein [SAR202 cluster bacterium]MDP7105095.1 hypothetical protein [SAR202 cluster bacterium]MDP7225227.1 hypothetical protein [SAR202 cluster bacterium]
MPEPVDKDQYDASLAKLQEIFAGINDTANEISKWRCPYKNVEDRCTAAFACRDQDRAVPKGELAVCTGSDKLDYRSAWKLSEPIE